MKIKFKWVLSLAVFLAVGMIGCKRQSDSGINNNVSYDFDISMLKNQNNLMPVVVIGSGPGGLGAALYTARIGFDTLVLEGSMPGGQLTQTSYIENWPGEEKILGNILMDRLKSQVKSFGVEFMADNAASVDLNSWPFKIVTESGKEIKALSIIIATGSTPITLGIDGEKEYWGKGVTTCAICDAPFYKNRSVVVIGGGDSAAEEALQLSAHAKSVEVFVRKDKMRASKAMQDNLSKVDNIKISYNREIKKIYGDNNHVQNITVYDNLKKENYEQSIDGVFLAIGHEPNTKLFIGQLDMDNSGYLILDGRSQRTSKLGVFAAGDVEDHVYKQAGVAAGSGIKAALDTGTFLQEIGVSFEFLQKLRGLYFNPAKQDFIIDSLSSEAELNNLLSKNRLVLVDFYGVNCPPCRAMAPIFKDLGQLFDGVVKFVKIDMADSRDLVMKYKVAKIPCFVMFKDGQEIARKYGAADRSKMQEWVSSFVD